MMCYAEMATSCIHIVAVVAFVITKMHSYTSIIVRPFQHRIRLLGAAFDVTACARPFLVTH